MRLRLILLPLLALALAFGAACADEADHLSLLSGWSDGEQVRYYDFGSNSALASDDAVAVEPVWVLVYGVNDDGTPDLVPDQHNIFDVRPGDPDYTDLWEVTLVTVPGDYEAASVRSFEEIRAAGFPIEATGQLVNCPFVDQGTTLDGGEQLARGWVDGEAVYYVDFGAASAEIAPLWVVSQSDRGAAIFDPAEGAAFRRVYTVDVPEGVDASALRSEEDLAAAALDMEATDTVLNAPLVNARGAPPASAPEQRYQSEDRAAFLSVVFGMIALAACVSGGAMLLARRGPGNASS